MNENEKKNGELVWISWSSRAIRDREGMVTEVLMIGNDITDLKRTEESLAIKTGELDSYAHVVSHDLRAPLTGITLANTALRDGLAEIENVGSDLLESVDIIDRNLSKAFTLVNELLALAEAGQKPTHVELVDVAKTVREILSERSIELNRLAVKVTIDEDMGVIMAHPIHVYQIFNNIIGNAERHNTSPEPSITIEYLGTDDAGAHLYKTCDNGSGIPEDDLERIFTPFFKAGKGSDTGLGLAIAKRVVEVYGGNIKAHNDNGACIEFSLKDFQLSES